MKDNKLMRNFQTKHSKLSNKNKNFLRLVASIKYKITLVETALCLAHTDDQMLGIYQVIKQMALKSTIYDIVPDRAPTCDHIHGRAVSSGSACVRHNAIDGTF